MAPDGKVSGVAAPAVVAQVPDNLASGDGAVGYDISYAVREFSGPINTTFAVGGFR